MKLREKDAAEYGSRDVRFVTAALLPAVILAAGFASLNQQFGWIDATGNINISPGLLIEIIAVLMALVAVQVLRSYHTTTGDAGCVRAAAVVLVTAASVSVSASTPDGGGETLNTFRIVLSLSLVVLTADAAFGKTTPLPFRSLVSRTIATGVVATVVVMALLALTTLTPSSSSINTSASLALAFAGLLLTIVGLRSGEVGKQILGLVVLSAASLGTHARGQATNDVLLVERLTLALLLGTLAIHGLVELRNMTIQAQSTVLRAAADLHESKGLLQQQREERAQLIHDSRNALLVIQAGLRSVADDSSEELISSLNSELNRIQVMIERSHTAIEPIDVIETLTPMAQCYHSGGMLLELRSPDDVRPVAFASRTKLVEVLQNLVENAIRHAKSDRAIEITVAAIDDHVQIDVRDHGAGIDLRDRLRVAERVGSLSGIGSGRGLSICQRMVQEMDGELDYFTPDIGAGSVFRVRLPLAAAVEDTSPFANRTAV